MCFCYFFLLLNIKQSELFLSDLHGIRDRDLRAEADILLDFLRLALMPVGVTPRHCSFFRILRFDFGLSPAWLRLAQNNVCEPCRDWSKPQGKKQCMECFCTVCPSVSPQCLRHSLCFPSTSPTDSTQGGGPSHFHLQLIPFCGLRKR